MVLQPNWRLSHGNHKSASVPRPACCATSPAVPLRKQEVLDCIGNDPVRDHRSQLLGRRAQIKTVMGFTTKVPSFVHDPSCDTLWPPPRSTSAPSARGKQICSRETAQFSGYSKPRKSMQNSISLGSSLATQLYTSFYKRKEERELQQKSEEELHEFSAALVKVFDRLAGDNQKSSVPSPSGVGRSFSFGSPTSASGSSLGNPDVEQLLAAVRHSDLDAGLRLKAMFFYLKFLAGCFVDGQSKAEVFELTDAVCQEKKAVLKEPWVAMDLADFCEEMWSITNVSDMVYGELERDVFREQRTYHSYILIDLAERHRRNGRYDDARRLWQRACEVPQHIRDPRARARSYWWRFAVEPHVPDDEFRVNFQSSAAQEDHRFVKLARGLQGDCNCRFGSLREKRRHYAEPESNDALVRAPKESNGTRRFRVQVVDVGEVEERTEFSEERSADELKDPALEPEFASDEVPQAAPGPVGYPTLPFSWRKRNSNPEIELMEGW